MEPNASQTPEEDESPEILKQEPDPAEVHQDTFRKVYLGQASDPLYPPHPGEPESPEDELEKAAMEDPGPQAPADPKPTFWRFIFLMLLAVAALGLVFRWLR